MKNPFPDKASDDSFSGQRPSELGVRGEFVQHYARTGILRHGNGQDSPHGGTKNCSEQVTTLESFLESIQIYILSEKRFFVVLYTASSGV